MAADEDEEPTQQWPSPAEEDTDPVGFAPVTYPPAVDPFVTDDEFSTTGDGFDSSSPQQVWAKPPASPRWNRRLLVAVLATAVVLGGMTAAILVAVRNSARMPAAAGAARPSAALDGGDPGAAAVTGPVDGRTSAAFDLVDGAASVRISARDLGEDLYRISTPSGSGVTPRVETDHNGVRVHLASTGSSAPAQVEIVLTTTVRWTLRLDGGTQQTAVDLSGAQVDSVDLGGGADRIDLTLPAPTGLMPVRLTGGVDQFRVRLADATPVRVRVQSGAGEVTLDGTTHRGIAPGRSFTAYGWGSAADGVDLFAVAGMSALTVTAG
jgi:hypothetical protein